MRKLWINILDTKEALLSRVYSWKLGGFFSALKSRNPSLYFMGILLVVFWLLEVTYIAIFIKTEKSHYLALSLFLLISFSILFVVCSERFFESWLREEQSSVSEKSRELFLMNLFFPLYMGPMWLLLTPFFLISSLDSKNFFTLPLLPLYLFISAWVILILVTLKNLSDHFLLSTPKKLKVQRSALIWYFFLLVLLTSDCVLLEVYTLKPLKQIMFQKLSQGGENLALNNLMGLFWELIMSGALFPCMFLIMTIARHLFLGHTHLVAKIIKFYIQVAFILIPITAILNINACNLDVSAQKSWPFAGFTFPTFLHQLPAIHNPLNLRFSGHNIMHPIIWILSIVFWRWLQNRSFWVEAWFRAFLLPLALFLSPQLIYHFVEFKKFWEAFLLTLGALGGFAALYKSYLGGVKVYCADLFREGDIITLPDENLSQVEVVSIDFMSTKVKNSTTQSIRSIPNQRFLSISVEKDQIEH